MEPPDSWVPKIVWLSTETGCLGGVICMSEMDLAAIEYALKHVECAGYEVYDYPAALSHSVSEAEIQAVIDSPIARKLVAKAIHALGIRRLRLEQGFKGLYLALNNLQCEVDGVDNGYCRLCGGHRMHDTRGNPQRCENESCISHQVNTALGEADAILKEVNRE